MKNVKKIVFLIFIFLLCGLCVAGIFFLDRDEDAVNDYTLENIKAETYKSYSKIFLGKQDIKQTIKVEGRILSRNENYTEEIKLLGTKEDLKISQGESFSANEVIFQRADVSYKTKYKGVLDKIYADDKYVYLTLVNYEDIYGYAELPLEYTQYIKEDDEITFLYMNQEKTGHVSYIAKIAENDAVTMEFELEDNECELIINAGVQLEIVKAKADSVIAVPQEALIRSKDEYYVLVSTDNGESELVAVSIGVISDDGYVEVKSGLTVDDIVLYDPTSSVNYDDEKMSETE